MEVLEVLTYINAQLRVVTLWASTDCHLFNHFFTSALLGGSVTRVWEMGSENPLDFSRAVVPAEEDQQEIGGLINSDGEEVEFSDISE